MHPRWIATHTRIHCNVHGLLSVSVSGILTRNWRIKLAALFLAVLLWVTMRLSDDRVSRLEIPAVQVRVDQVASDWLLRGSPSPSTVGMTVTGPMGDLFRVAMAEPVVIIPVDSVPGEDLVLELVPDWVWNVDRGSVVIEDFAPSSVRLLFERYEDEDIPVSLRLTGRLSDSLALVSEPRANLLFAQVRGPASEMDALETVFLVPFDLSGLEGSGQFDVVVDTAGLGGLVVSPMMATVTVEVATRESRVVGPVPVEFVAGAEDLVLEPDTVNVMLSGAGVLLADSEATDLVASLAGDPAEVRRAIDEVGEIRLPVEVSGLPRFVDGAAEPDSVTVRRIGPP